MKEIETKTKEEPKKKNKFTKLNSIYGKAYEFNVSLYISKKLFLEDANFINSNLFYNIPFEFESLKNDLLLKLIPNVKNQTTNKERIEIINNINQDLCKYYSHQDEYNNIYIGSDSFSSSSDNSLSSNKKFNKNLTEMEFDLFIKNIQGKKLNEFLKEVNEKKNLINIQELYKIEDDKKYNICFEFTYNSNDIIIKKFPQLFKFILFFNFLYKLNKNFTDHYKNLNEINTFFLNKTKFINFKSKLIIILISNGIYENFEKIKKFLNAEIYNDYIKKINEINDSYNIYMIYYSNRDELKEELKEELKNELTKLKLENEKIKKNYEEQQKENEKLRDRLEKQQNEINEIQKILKSKK